MSKSWPIPQPRTFIISTNLEEPIILSWEDFSAFNILPNTGKIAWNLLLRACLHVPAAESPSTKNISHCSGSLLEHGAKSST